jgi:stage III sporulation protein AF
MDGLSSWLRQIIAVVLLASLIDLLLPNRTMQRYVRLVAGLFILMTVATPVMHWMKGDFGTKLAEGLNSVERSPSSAGDQLALIEEQGAKLRDKQLDQAAELVAARLSSAIRGEIEQTQKRGVSKVDVITKRQTDGSLDVSKVVVLLKPDSADGAGTDARSTDVKDVEPIAPVDIHIGVEVVPDVTSSNEAPAIASDGDYPSEDADDRTRLAISALVASRFGLAASIVEVKQQAAGSMDSY